MIEYMPIYLENALVLFGVIAFLLTCFYIPFMIMAVAWGIFEKVMYGKEEVVYKKLKGVDYGEENEER